MNEHDRAPRPGLPGAWDRLVGPGASGLENAGTVGAAVLGATVGLAGGGSSRVWGPSDAARRPCSAPTIFGGAWLNTAVWRPTPEMGWFPAVFFLKLLASHAGGEASARK